MRRAERVERDAPVAFVELEDDPVLDRAAHRVCGDIGFRGRVDLLADSYLTDGMTRARWLHGGAQRDPKQMLAEVTAVVARLLEREAARSDGPDEPAATPNANPRSDEP